MLTVLRCILYPAAFFAGLAVICAAIALTVVFTAYPRLPEIDVLTDYRPKMPLQVFTSDGFLIGEFGAERRIPIGIRNVPAPLKQALLAAEDEHFYRHMGVDPIGVVRAAVNNLRKGNRSQGSSTITMQLARTFFLSPERSYERKFYEALLSFKIESTLTKEQIFEIYINQIFLGQHAYGFAAASQTYFGKPLSEINIAEAAMLAGIPKSPSKGNPIVDPKYARTRQQYVLRRMRELDFITETQYRTALETPILIQRESVASVPVHAEYVAEMARQIAVERFSDAAYSAGLQVITTISREQQETAYEALRQGILEYDRRHGYRGAEAYIDLQRFGPDDEDREQALDNALREFPSVDGLHPAVVLEASPRQVQAYLHGGETITLEGEGIKIAAAMLGDRAPANKKLRPGAVIRLMQVTLPPPKNGQTPTTRWQITQLPEVEAAFIAASPVDGAVHALVGGFDFNRGKYNHVTQAWRQPGSSFKPFIYSAALEKGFSPGSIIRDAPIEVATSSTGSRVWRPKNYDGRHEGPMTLRTALAKSKNIPAVQLILAVGTGYTQNYIAHFGFDARRNPPYLTLALGAGSVTPWQMVGAYSIFANGGYRVQPHIVKEIRDRQGHVLAQAVAPRAGDETQRAIDPRNAYIMNSMLRDVAIRGTAARASSILKRRDLAGKTGTTNDYLDAWFCGFQQTVVGCAWMGFDQPQRLGSRETGGQAALPIWIEYMKTALKGVPEQLPPQPEGIARAFGDLYYTENIPAVDPMAAFLEEQEEEEEGQEAIPVETIPAPPAPPPPLFPGF
ncbi:MAG: PBP1A family penicillin-binding protein [Zoogloeaceae bacterium]|nr:PBP1A family penicillin-binding protein [Zoogloeaceae bacterium]